MSKFDKDIAQSDRDAGPAVEAATADIGAQPMQAEPNAQAQAHAQTEPESEQQRQFNSWLDRTLPRLMELLSAAPSSAVTSPGHKPKH